MRLGLAVVAAMIAAGCVSSESVPCGDGTFCPRDRTCRLIGQSYQCVSEEQIAACAGKPDLASCPGGTCLGGVCIGASCGDGRVGPLEVCDDGNTEGRDGCSPDCRSDESCGNGIVDLGVGEQCDDGQELRGLSHDGCSSICREESPVWRTLPDLDEAFVGTTWAATYDRERGRIVALALSAGVMRTIERDAKAWNDVTPTTISPSRRAGFSLVYDDRRRRAVMFGGLGFRDTWEWDGGAWELRQPATSPPPRIHAAMAYDPIGARVVLFGGRADVAGTNREIGDTWAWDGTNWTQIAGPGPAPRAESAMAFDPVRGVLVLFGGVAQDTYGDTWELSGSTWTERQVQSPGPRHQHAMAFDPITREVILCSGRDQLGVASSYTWDGTRWALRANDHSVNGREQLVSLPDQHRLLLLSAVASDEWTGAGWQREVLFEQGGVTRFMAAAAMDAVDRRVLVFGGLIGAAAVNTTFSWRGAWERVGVGGSPPAATGGAMAFDEERREFVLFGGVSTVPIDETWVFGAADTWTRRTPAVSPSPRQDASLTYDRARHRSVLFGGKGATRLDDTWTWDGATWTQVMGVSPPARSDHAAAYDPIRNEIVLFGGQAGVNAALGDTWTFDGAWTLRSEAGPTPRFSHGMAWDGARRRIVLHGGTNGASELGDVWEWDGTAWSQIATPPIASRTGHTLLPGLEGAGVIRFGAPSSAIAREQIVQLRWDSAGSGEACVTGVDADGDGWLEPGCGGGDPDCWSTCAPSCLPATSCVADAMGCGDGTCSSARETCRTCPADCGPCAPWCGDLACDAGETHATCAADCP